MNVFAWIIFGLAAGGIAKFLMPGKDVGGCLTTIIIGIAGSLLGGFISTRVFGSGRTTGFDLPSLGVAILGSFLLLLVFRLLMRRRHPER